MSQSGRGWAPGEDELAALEEIDALDADVSPLDGTVTNTRFAMPVAPEHSTDVGPAAAQRAREDAAARRAPAPLQRRPTLFGTDAEAAGAAIKTLRPGVMEPVRARSDGGRADVGSARETSDIIQTYDASHGSSPRPLVAPPPAEAPRSRLERRPPRPPEGPSLPRPPAPTSVPVSPSPRPPSTLTPVLPLDPEQIARLIHEQRGRLGPLRSWARILEVTAGVLGTVSVSGIVVALAAAMLARGSSLLVAATAGIASAAGVGLAIGLVAAAAVIRQVAHVAAQQAALVESLCQNPRR